MFEVRCIVADKRLSEALRALGSLTLEPPVVLPINEASHLAVNGSDRAAKAATGGSTPKVLKYLKDNKLKKVTASQLSTALIQMGYSKNGYSYALKRLIEQRVVKKSKEPHTYEVMKHGES